MYLHISNQMRKQDKTQYCQEYTVQSLTNVGAHRKSLAIATVQKMKGWCTLLENHLLILTTDKWIMMKLKKYAELPR
jgi:hypothetical protein